MGIYPLSGGNEDETKVLYPLNLVWDKDEFFQ